MPPGGGYCYRANWGTDALYRKVRPTWHAVADTATTAGNTAVIVNVLANDSDPDGDPLTVTVLPATGKDMADLIDRESRWLKPR